ncbi:hypothetical protein [Azospirillum thermophilum]|uniref:hypothetical protein n=1 Tax=Azospirillum thermophilum TaxID=2202148 RepID=UPI00143D1D51|nr:hypothetical protein [Azospirillum thermophilum]
MFLPISVRTAYAGTAHEKRQKTADFKDTQTEQLIFVDRLDHGRLENMALKWYQPADRVRTEMPRQGENDYGSRQSDPALH